MMKDTSENYGNVWLDHDISLAFSYKEGHNYTSKRVLED